MLKRYAAFFSISHSITDICVIAFTWFIVYHLRYYSNLFSVEKGLPEISEHLVLTIPVTCLCYLSCFWVKLYTPKRSKKIFAYFLDLIKACFLSSLFIFSFFYYIKDTPYSRILLLLFSALLFVGLCLSHILAAMALRVFRRKGYNLRYYAIIGANSKGEQLAKDIANMSWLGLRGLFFVDDDPSTFGTTLQGLPVYGPIEKILEMPELMRLDEVYLAVGGESTQKAYVVLESLQANGINIRIIPDWGNLMSLSNTSVVNIGSQFLFSAEDSPLNGFNIILKSVFDITVAILLLVILCVPFCVIALIIKLTSEGPVFYKQARLGMDQKKFDIFKFRTMKVDAESEGPQWSRLNDDRCTPIGRWLRKTSIDELPQLINVAKGDMSLVGPRPERAFFVKQFSENYKKYMLRHKVKSGMTGWAQIHGYRGDTSLRKRLVFDLYYIRNWSFWLDLWILARTPLHVIKGENAN